MRPLEPGRATLRNLAFVAVTLLLAGCRAPQRLFPIWPVDHGGILPLAAASAGTRVEEVDGELHVELASADDLVVSRGGHQMPARLAPVLRMRVRIRSDSRPAIAVRSASSGNSVLDATPVQYRVPAAPPGEAIDLILPLTPGWPGEAQLDIFALSLVNGAGELHIEEAWVETTTAPVYVRVWWRELRSVGARGLNFYLLAFALAFGLLALLWNVLGVGGQRLLGTPWPRRWPARALLSAIAVAWCYQGATMVPVQVGKLVEDAGLFMGLTQTEKRVNVMGPGRYGAAVLADRWLAPETPVGISPGGSNLPTWLEASALAPRPIVPLPCAVEGELPSFVTATAGCFAEAIELPELGRRVVELPAGLAGRFLRYVTISFEPASFDPDERAVVSVEGPDGGPLWSEHLNRSSPFLGVVGMDLPDQALRVRLMVAGGDGALTVTGAAAGLLPVGMEPVDSDASGNVLAKRAGTPLPGARPLLPTEDHAPSPFELPRLGAALLLYLAFGESLLRWLFRGGGGPRGAMRLAYAWLVGLGGATLIVQIVVFCGIPHWPWPLLPMAVVGVFGWRHGRVVSSDDAPRERWVPDERLLLGIALVMVLVAVADTGLVPMRVWDELINWGYRGHVYYHVGPTDAAVAEYARLSPRHKAYPPGIPLVESLTARLMGRWDSSRATVPFAFYYGSLVLLVFGAVRAMGSRRLALLYAALAATGPMALTMSTVGMADLPLACLFAAAVLAVVEADGDTGGAWLMLAGLLGALMSFTKLDGGALKLLLAGLVLLRLPSIGATWGVRGRRYAGFLAAAFLPVLPWWHVYDRLGLKDWVVNRDTLSLAHLASKVGLIPDIVAATGRYLTTAAWGDHPHWNATYIALLAVLLAAPWTLLRSGNRIPALALIGGIVGYMAIYVVSPQGLHQMERSLDRILLHFYPLAVALVGRCHGLILAPRVGKSSMAAAVGGE